MPAGSAVGPGEIDELPDKPGRFGLGMHEHEVARERQGVDIDDTQRTAASGPYTLLTLPTRRVVETVCVVGRGQM